MSEAEGRALRKGNQTELNYIYAALGMEKDDSSDANFLPDDSEETEDVDQSSDDLDDPAPQSRKGKSQIKRARKMQQKPSTIGKGKVFCGAKCLHSPHVSTEERSFSPHYSPPPFKKEKTVSDAPLANIPRDNTAKDCKKDIAIPEATRPEYVP
ncbi:hypothetical protein GN958_ATG22749 [Phytophthora infestans]|uniref:Uncharacterized protein n=1 Tax=Phytophthora infestans TaxID=4787 RepID=A0A8S9TIE6_PHYIN|nr:hypothetical protein GN958_ATG22749 [Phytophthora infestans]